MHSYHLPFRSPANRPLCTRNVSRALIERPYSREPQAVGAVYDRPGFFVQSRSRVSTDNGEMKSPQEKSYYRASLNRRVVAEAVGTAMLLIFVCAVCGCGLYHRSLLVHFFNCFC